MEYNQRRKEQARQTEQLILQTALKLMRERDFDRVSIRDICREAGITTGAFYHHFPSKEDLLTKGFTPLDRYIEEVMARCGQLLPQQRLEKLLRAYGHFIQTESGELTGRYYQRRLEDPSSQSLDRGRYIDMAMVDCFRQAEAEGSLAPGYTPEWLAEFCYRHFRGVVIDWVLHGYDYPLLEKMEEDYVLFQRLFRGE